MALGNREEVYSDEIGKLKYILFIKNHFLKRNVIFYSFGGFFSVIIKSTALNEKGNRIGVIF